MFSILPQNKKCSKCGGRKRLSEFGKDSRGVLGVRSDCKKCRSLSSALYWKNNKDSISKKNKEYYETNKEKRLTQVKAWYQENKDRHSGYSKKYIENNPEKHLASVRKAMRKWSKAHPEYKDRWRKENPDKGRQYSQKRRARISGVGGEITAQEWESLKKKYGYRCLCCERTEDEVDLHLDHVTPIALGGKNIIENAQPLCKSCNSKKHMKTIDYRNNCP